MLSRNPVRNTTRDYPWAKVFFGFVGGMILCNFVDNVLTDIRFIVSAVMLASPVYTDMDEPVLSILLLFLFCFVVSLRRSSWFGGMQDVTVRALPGQ